MRGEGGDDSLSNMSHLAQFSYSSIYFQLVIWTGCFYPKIHSLRTFRFYSKTRTSQKTFRKHSSNRPITIRVPSRPNYSFDRSADVFSLYNRGECILPEQWYLCGVKLLKD